MTYLLMSLPFLAVGILAFLLGAAHAHRRGAVGRYFSSWAAATGALLALTAVFDNVMMAAGFFDYGIDQISGIRFGLMPFEDFLYPLAGALLLAGVWQLLTADRETGEHADV
ncbi:lycopene cyclase domain-containing protein [Microbacterium sp. H1-D42]|uniref:lycopene cyclase domain-containing protein n=1 Tax=Microbacterium sp. H1-D42 TaxID=2925844 RepID=UPI001F53AEC3|nr:lycopene cyclase domain-containing protein [Microbacterium sp. H1-D42]UNK70299.1 lycopene cyclase domain-containing protein [Microbacterium sp. H1-D42]